MTGSPFTRRFILTREAALPRLKIVAAPTPHLTVRRFFAYSLHGRQLLGSSGKFAEIAAGAVFGPAGEISNLTFMNKFDKYVS
jgi:hypothetical protein